MIKATTLSHVVLSDPIWSRDLMPPPPLPLLSTSGRKDSGPQVQRQWAGEHGLLDGAHSFRSAWPYVAKALALWLMITVGGG